MPTSWPKSLDTLYGGCEYFASASPRSPTINSKFNRLPVGKLSPVCRCSMPCRTARSRSAIPRCTITGDPAFTFGTALPFGLNTRQHISWLYVGGGTEMLNDLLKEYNCLGIPTGSTGAQMGGWFRKEIKSSEDLKGLKFRVGGFAGTIIAKVGGVPQQIAAGDIYPARSRRARSMRPNGSGRMTTRSSVS